MEPMDDNQAQKYLQKLEAQATAGTLTMREALLCAMALGAETERMTAMHHACQEYSRARAAREAAFR